MDGQTDGQIYGQTDMRKLIGACRNYVNALETNKTGNVRIT